MSDDKIVSRRAADCLNWQAQKARFLGARGELTPELAKEIHTFRQQAYEFVTRNGIDERNVERYLI